MKKYNIEITVDELNIVLTALQKLPWEVVNDTIRHIVSQAEATDKLLTQKDNDRQSHSVHSER